MRRAVQLLQTGARVLETEALAVRDAVFRIGQPRAIVGHLELDLPGGAPRADGERITLAEIEREISRLPTIGKHDVDEVVRFEVTGGLLVVSTKLESMKQMSRVEVPQMPGPATVRVRADAPPRGRVPWVSLQFIHRTIGTPRTG